MIENDPEATSYTSSPPKFGYGNSPTNFEYEIEEDSDTFRRFDGSLVEKQPTWKTLKKIEVDRR